MEDTGFEIVTYLPALNTNFAFHCS